MLSSCALAVGAALLSAPPREARPDGPTLLRRVIEEREHQQELERQYAFHERTTTRNLSKDGTIAFAKSETFLVTPAPGGEYKRLISKNGRPLDPDDEAEEEEKFQEYLEEQLKQTAESLSEKTENKMKGRLERYGTRLNEALEVYDFEDEPDEIIDGVPVRVFRFAPKPGSRHDSRSKKILARLEGRIWIDPSRDQVAKLELRFRESLKFLGGIFGRVSEGSEATARAWLDEDVWLLDRIDLSLDARLYFLKTYRQEVIIDYSSYEKFSVSTEERARTTPPGR